MKKLLALALALGSAGFLYGSIQVISPNGSESWVIGSPYTISWTARGVSTTVNIFLIRGSRAVGRINADPLPASATSLRWEKAGVLTDGTWASAGTDYKINVLASDGRASDVSDGTFALQPRMATVATKTLSPRAFRITEPLENVKIDAGLQVILRWESRGYEGTRLAIVANPVLDDPAATPAPSVPLGNAVIEAGSFTWNIPRTYYGRWKLRAVTVPDGVVLGGTPGFFDILPPTRFRFLSPIGGEIFRPGDNLLIRWEPIDPIPEYLTQAVLVIWKYPSGCRSGTATQMHFAPSPIEIMAREYRFRIPRDFPESSFYLVEITAYSRAFVGRHAGGHRCYSACFTVAR